MEIFVFKTNVNTTQTAEKVHQLLLSDPQITKVTFDLEDCDKILRIESENLVQENIVHQLENIGIQVQELPDQIEEEIVDS